MKKLASIPLTFGVCLLIASAAFGQANVNESVHRDFNAFASGSTLSGQFGHISISVDDSLQPNQAPDIIQLNAFQFAPNINIFVFESTQLTHSQFSFDQGQLSTATLNASLFDAFSGSNIPVNLTWTAVSPIIRTENHQSQHTATQNFSFTAIAASRQATLSGTADGIVCCSFSHGTLSKDMTQQVIVTH